MKSSLGFVTLSVVLLAAIRLTSGPARSSENTAATPAAAIPLQGAGRTESCEAFADATTGAHQPGGAGSSPADKGEITALVGRFLYGSQRTGPPPAAALPGDVRIMIATVPDPVHTHLSLQFDRTLEAIQQAAQDENYTYDSSWLPWKSRGSDSSSLAEQNEEASEAAAREICPGIILFRRNMRTAATSSCRPAQNGGPAPSDAPYGCGMVVLVVGENPTGGLNTSEWNNAVAWIERYASKNRTDTALRVFGPIFSGSMPSFVRALRDVDKSSTTFTSILLYSGRIRGCASWRWLKVMLSPLTPPAMKLPVRTADFEENDAVQIDRFYRYLEDRGHRISEVAILSEDETTYGGLPDARSGADQTNSQPPPCVVGSPEYPQDDRPVHVYYPRDISAIRSAYQEQSIFSSESAPDSVGTPHTVLRPESSQSADRKTDTIEPFSGQNLALTQEAQLYGIVSTFKTHGIRYIVLRSTNSLDYLFLARFLHRAYPAAYLVTSGTDMLFGREIDSTEFRGVLALSNFPLMARGQDWTAQTERITQHAHRIFGSYTMEGSYLATRFLIRDDAPKAGDNELERYEHPGVADIPDYAPPFWDTSSESPGESAPSTWLSVVGRGGYWPLALLDRPSRFGNSSRFSNLAIIRKVPDSMGGNGQFGKRDQQKRNPPPPPSALRRLTLSEPWRFFCMLAVVAAFIHFFAVFFGWKHQDLSVFVHFTPLRGGRGQILIALGGALVCSILLLLFLASWRMSPWLGPVDLLWTYAVGATAIAACVLTVVAIALWHREDTRPATGEERYVEDDASRQTASRWKFASCVLLMLALLVAFSVCAWQIFGYSHSDPNGVATAYRSVYLTSGVSPVTSLLFLLVGLYWWFWQSLSGLALLGDGRPVLPAKQSLPRGLSRVSDEMAGNIEAAAIPFPHAAGSKLLLYLIPLLIVISQISVMQRDWSQTFDLILHSLENTPFSWMLHLLFWTALYLLLLECVQLVMTWFSLKRLLLALNRLPLRRTFAALQGLSMRSLWSLSGTSSRARYKAFSHQLESLLHLRNELEAFEYRDCGDQAIRKEVRAAWAQGWHFVQNRSEQLDLAMLNDAEIYRIRRRLSHAVEEIVRSLLVTGWLAERSSMDLNEATDDGKREERLPLSEVGPVRFAEEFICMVYVGYLQNTLARMRTMVLSMAGIFAAVALSVAFYPYTPRPTIALALMLLLLGIGVIVGHVCAGLDRDTTLSHITNTEPGSLGAHFWLRILSFIGVPALGLIVAQFPEITDLVFSWIQPGLNAVK